MILPIYLYGQPVLKKVAEDINADYPNLSELIQNMFDTMHQAQGIGLAAPQIGLAIRLVVVDLDVLPRMSLSSRTSVAYISMPTSLRLRMRPILWRRVV